MRSNNIYDVEQGYLREGSKISCHPITAIRRRLIDELDKLSPKTQVDAASTNWRAMPMRAVATEECRRTRADGICAR